jgi:hypothetical protein
MAKIRLKKKKQRYATVSRNLLANQNISLQSKGLGSWLELHQDGFELNFEFILQNMKEGKHTLRKVLKELRTEDFLLTLQTRNEKGEFETIWVFDSEGGVSEYDLPTTEIREAVTPEAVTPKSVKRTQIRKKNIIKDKKEKTLSERASFLKSQNSFINYMRATFKNKSIDTIDSYTGKKIQIAITDKGYLYDKNTGESFSGTRALEMWEKLYAFAIENPLLFLDQKEEETA